MNWKRYKVTYYDGIPMMDFWRNFCHTYEVEALNAQDAIRMAKGEYKREFEAGIRNMRPIKEVKFKAEKRDY